MTARDRKRFFICLGLAVAIGLVMSFLAATRRIAAMEDVQNLVTDATIFKSRTEGHARAVSLVHIDEKSVSALKDKYGRVFSWPRSLHAQVLHNLADARARVVAYDILWDAPGCPASAPPPCQEDVDYAQAIDYARSRPLGGTQVVLAAAGLGEGQSTRPGEPVAYPDIIPPLADFASRATAIASIHPDVDTDGAVRRIPLVVTMKGKTLPAISLQAAASYFRRPTAIETLGLDGDHGFVMTTGRPIPTDDRYRAIVNYEGPPSHLPDRLQGPVPVVSFIDVLNGTFDRKLVEDKIVFVGLTAIGFADDYIVPTSPGVKMSGVEIHAQTTDMIVKGAYLQRQSTGWMVAFIMLLTVVPGLILARLQPVVAAVVTLIMLVAYVFAAWLYGLLATNLVDRATNYTVLSSVYPGAGLVLTFIVVLLYRIIFEQAEQRLTRGTMGKYLSPAVMNEVLKAPESLRLGGQKRQMSVLFSDIRGFTSISEKMDPTALVNFLNNYLTAMTDIVFQKQGVLDKYMGDAIMAFWGAPKDQPNHAEMACRTGYAMIHRLRELRQDWIEQGLPSLDIGVGINTGPMTVGNVGSRMRFDYTVMGDAVNLGSRLEGTNKEYGTNIIISEGTLREVEGKFVVRYLDLIAVKGKQEGVAIYELLAPVEETAAHPPAGFLDIWDGAMALYRNQHFAEALAAFERVLEIKPEDPPAQVFIERCREMAAAPPGVAWDGVYVMTHK